MPNTPVKIALSAFDIFVNWQAIGYNPVRTKVRTLLNQGLMSTNVTDSPDLTIRDFVQSRYDAVGTGLGTSGNVIVLSGPYQYQLSIIEIIP